jgi:7-cyano-7-deazaguanine synthase in queuosine biosynthesis
MAEHWFFCGTGHSGRLPKHGHHLDVCGKHRNIVLNPLQISKPLLQEVSPRLRDLIDIAAYVFAADRVTGRGGRVGEGMAKEWRRDLSFVIAVRDPAHWSQPELQLALRDLLGFMSEDAFSFEFTRLEYDSPLQHHFDFVGDPVGSGPIGPVVLFSGGLDSLAGAMTELSDGKRIVLVTHQSANLMTSYQDQLVTELKRRFPHRVLYVPLRKNLTNGLRVKENSQRTRTFLYSVIGAAVASILRASGIRFYENGIMSINLPISPQAVGTSATRSTHPRVLAEMSVFLQAAIGHTCEVDNPFILKTKAEVLNVIAQSGQSDLIGSTMSCTELRRRVADRSHCGACIQCLHRRFAVLAAGLGSQDPSGSYANDLLEAPRRGYDRAMLVEFVRSARRFREMSDDGFLRTFSLEFARLSGTSDFLRGMFALHRRHGDQVVRVLEDGLAQYKQELSKGLMAPGSLLTFVIAEQMETRAPTAAPTPMPAAPSPSIQLMIDVNRGQFSLNASPPLRGKRSVALLALLAVQHRTDTHAGRRPEMFAYVSKEKLTRALGIADDALRGLVDRLRDRIGRTSAPGGTASDDRELVIQSRQWKGYRLNPAVYLVTPN